MQYLVPRPLDRGMGMMARAPRLLVPSALIPVNRGLEGILTIQGRHRADEKQQFGSALACCCAAPDNEQHFGGLSPVRSVRSLVVAMGGRVAVKKKKRIENPKQNKQEKNH